MSMDALLTFIVLVSLTTAHFNLVSHYTFFALSPDKQDVQSFLGKLDYMGDVGSEISGSAITGGYAA